VNHSETYTARDVAQIVVGSNTLLALGLVAGALLGAILGAVGIMIAFIVGIVFVVRSIVENYWAAQ
jgi:hypothetical protein